MSPRTPPGLLALGFLAAMLAGCRKTDEPEFCAVPIGDSPSRGAEDAPVAMVEFADFECPFCRNMVPTVEEVVEARPGEVRHVFKHLPNPNHEHAMSAAIAARCAHAQGLFWEMHDALFAPDSSLDEAGLGAAAEASGLDPDAWQSCRDGDQVRDEIAADVAQAEMAGVTATPTFFVNGSALVGAQPLAELLSAVDQAAGEVEASGLEPAAYYAGIEARDCR